MRLKQAELADRLGVSARTVGRYEADERSPEKEEFAKLVEAGADIVWLITGERTALAQIQAIAGRTIDLPRYEARLSAGAGSSEPEREEIDGFAVPEDFVRQVLRRSPRGLIVARADGNSMAPTINDGDLLIIDTTDQRLQNSRIYALSVDGNLFVKRIARSIKAQVQLVSDNKEYETELLPDDVDVRIIGQVIWHGGSLE